ncbi:MAG: ABC transporter ATP-binding protein [Synergistes sp.]|nr:ABC transporter ATP-binding protein [Synergistes sp.]
MFAVENLSVSYPDGTNALSDVTFDLSDGENTALIGANGVGKSSLILASVGVIKSSGKITACGTVLTDRNLNNIRSLVGVVFQNPEDQLFTASVYDDIAFGPRNMGLGEDEIAERIENTAKVLRIEDICRKSSLKMSGGEKRLAAIASVLVMRPSVMLFDEPTSFLDPRARRELAALLKSLPQTKLIATHDLAFAADVCPRSIVLKEGRIFADCATHKLLSNEDLMYQCGL